MFGSDLLFFKQLVEDFFMRIFELFGFEAVNSPAFSHASAPRCLVAAAIKCELIIVVREIIVVVELF